jgi:predicted nucleic acid-binding Zn ribbon protein
MSAAVVGYGPDSRDPQPLGNASRDLAKKQGWSGRVAEGAVFGQWSTVVGADISEHATPTGLRDGVLSVTAESTAWATQLRLIQKQVLAKIAAAVGDGVVTSLRPDRPVVAEGPAAHLWPRPPRHLRMTRRDRSAQGRHNAEKSAVKRRDAGQIEKFRTRRN